VRSAVDSSVLLDVFSRSEAFYRTSQLALRRAMMEGSLVACEVVWAEVRAHFPTQKEFDGALTELGVSFDLLDAECAALAGETRRRYRGEGGPRNRLIPDFLIAAHASLRSDRLVTRDRGFLRRYYPRLRVLDPTA
jgi:predicted nucleic acid-binding protein